MSYFTLPLAPRATLKATEYVLERLYSVAKLGLKGDKLAVAAGLLPQELQRLRDHDPRADLAVLKGMADGEHDVASALYQQALLGDTKAAKDYLTHVHKWSAPQQVQIQIEGRISITKALEDAEKRVIDGAYTVIEQETLNAVDSVQSGRGTAADDPAVVAGAQERPIGVGDVRLPVGAEGHAA